MEQVAKECRQENVAKAGGGGDLAGHAGTAAEALRPGIDLIIRRSTELTETSAPHPG